MGRKKRRSTISSRNQRNTKEIREKDRERKRKKRAILRAEEVANQPMMGESNGHRSIVACQQCDELVT